MKSREQIIAENPLAEYCRSKGIELKGSGAERMAKCPFHEDRTPSFSVNVNKQAWLCRGGCGGGSIIDLMAKFEGLNPKVIMKRLGEVPDSGGWKPGTPLPGARRGQPEAKANAIDPSPTVVKESFTSQNGTVRPKLVKAYDYRNAKGDLVYQACRLEPKSFRQRRPAPDWTSEKPVWIWNMEGVERVLYQLPKILKTKNPVVICEGEKDCDTVTALGLMATTNVGGAGKWLDAYAEHFIGKEVILCGDNDQPGREHMEKVLESLAGKAKSVRVVRIPDPFKDVSDWISGTKWVLTEGQSEAETRFLAFQKLVDDSPLFDRGINLPIYTIAELRQQYLQSISRSDTHSLDLSRWLPTLGRSVRPLVAGEVLCIIGGTGTGKTALAQNLALHARPLKTLFFEQELPGSLTLERFTAIATRTDAKEVYARYKSGDRGLDAETDDLFSHVNTVTLSRLSVTQMEEHISRSALKFGEPPALVIVDYIQIMGGKGERRERIASAAEGLKQMAKNTNTIVVMLSQISRKGKDAGNEVELDDGKEAGEIENSSGVVLGAWRDDKDDSHLTLRVLKNTKGLAGKRIECNFDGAKLLVTERVESAVSDADVPGYKNPHND